MSKQIFSSDKVNSFRLKPEQAEKLNKLISETKLTKVGEAVLFLAEDRIEAAESKGFSQVNFEFLFTDNGRLKREVVLLEDENKRLQSEIENPKSNIAQNPLTQPAYLSLKKELESVLFKDCEIVPEISDDEFVNLLVDMCQRDPCNEFPSPTLAQAIYDKHKTTNHVQETQEESQPEAGTGKEPATGHTTAAGPDTRTEGQS